jgi:AraC family transcriptional regulator of adaptative response/methylated-DNA-[protein]-cysteine methyltransferase
MSNRSKRESDMSEQMVSAVREAASYIEQRAEAEADGPVSLKQLSDHTGISPWHLQRQFKRVLGVSPRQYDDALRMKRLRKGLKSGVGVAGATFEAGYGSSSRVYERAAAALGMTPASYAKGGKGQQINYGIAPCALGLVLVAATPRGICRVQLGANDQAMVHQLKSEFAEAEIDRDDEALEPYLEEILPGMGRIAANPGRRDPQLRPGGRRDRQPGGCPRRRQCLCQQPGRDRHPLPPRFA